MWRLSSSGALRARASVIADRGVGAPSSAGAAFRLRAESTASMVQRALEDGSRTTIGVARNVASVTRRARR